MKNTYNGLRFGLCCKFFNESIRFRTTTATHILKLQRSDGLAKISSICLSNAEALMASLKFCQSHGIGSFRVNSQILPLKTHPEAGYEITELPDNSLILSTLENCRRYAATKNLRLTFHPDQFVVLNSPKSNVVVNSVRELEYQAGVAELIGADVINIHGGGVYGDKTEALRRLVKNMDKLSDSVRERLTLENDDRSYTPADLIPICKRLSIPFVYDVHHHRCLPDDMSVEMATRKAIETWNREPLFHISSPKEGWDGPRPSRHHDYINPADFPECWNNLQITIEVEAKAKEAAIFKLQSDLKTTL